MTEKIWNKESVLELIATNDRAVARAVLALYARQTADEQSSEHTRHHNGVGFNHVDAPFMTSIAKALPKWNNHMTPRQLRACRKVLPKYHRQLVEIANENQAAREPQTPPAHVIDQRPANTLYGRF